MAFPEAGDYVVPQALVPVTIDRENDTGRYVENPTSGSNTRSEASIAATSPTRTALFLDLGDTLVRTKDKEIDRSQKGRVSFLPNVIDIFRSRTDEFDAVFVIRATRPSSASKIMAIRMR